MWHWLKGHRWQVISLYCDGQTHYISHEPSGYFTVTHALFKCTVCGSLKSKDLKGWFKMENKDSLAEAIKYLETA